MIPNSDKLSSQLHYFFTCYLPQHRDLSPHTLASYKQTFIHLMHYWNELFPQCPDPAIDRFEVRFLLEFLSHLEKDLKNTASTRNARLAALKSFFKMVSLFEPRYQNQCRQILMIPAKRFRRWPLDYLDKKEVDTVFASVDIQTHGVSRPLHPPYVV
jgi:integrase/recombinase XerD